MSRRIILLPFLVAFASLVFAGPLLAQTTAFTYQGRLADNSTPASAHKLRVVELPAGQGSRASRLFF